MTCRIQGCAETKKGLWGGLDKCSKCYREICPNHMITLQQHLHLFEGDLDDVITVLCEPCAEGILKETGRVNFTLYTQTNIDCANKNCKNSHSLLCGECGHRFCKKHLISKEQFDDDDWQEKIQFSTADGICEPCFERVNLRLKDGSGILSNEQLVVFADFGIQVLRTSKKEANLQLQLGARLILFVSRMLRRDRLSREQENDLSRLAKYCISGLGLLPVHLHAKADNLEKIFFFAQYFLDNPALLDTLEDAWAEFSSVKRPLQEVCQVIQGVFTKSNTIFQKAGKLLIGHHNNWPMTSTLALSGNQNKQITLPKLLRFNAANEQDIVIFVHGFLGVGSNHPDWKKQLLRYMQRPASQFIYRWNAGYTEDLLHKVELGSSAQGSNSFFGEKANVAMMSLFKNVGTATGAQYYWQQCWENADFQALQLASLIQREVFQDCRITLVGHSLGGRIVLKAAEYCGALIEELGMPAVQLRSMVALAPTIRDSELDWELVKKGVSQKPEVFYSNEDLVLSLMSQAGEKTLYPPVGFQGANTAGVFNIDCSRFDLGHDDYAVSWGKVFRYTNSILRC